MNSRNCRSPSRYCILEGDNKLPVIWLKSWILRKIPLSGKEELKSTSELLAWRLSDIQSHFNVKEGIVLKGHKISKKGIEVDKAKNADMQNTSSHPPVKGIRVIPHHEQPNAYAYGHSALKYLFAKKMPMARLLPMGSSSSQEFDFKVIDTKGEPRTSQPIILSRL
ncbi:hypothetical protein Tco_0630269 [Tanacetum coccineum]